MSARSLPPAALVAALCLQPLAGCAQPAPATAPVDADTRRTVVEGAIRELNARYVFPAAAKQAQTLLQRERAAGGLEQADSVAFATRLTELLQQATRDKHVRVRFSERPLPADDGDAPPSAEELAYQERQLKAVNYGVERVERLPGNIGYIDLRNFHPVGQAAPALSAAMNLVAHTDALIVDLRQNGGGDPAAVAWMTSYLLDERTHLNSFWWREGERTEQFWTHDFVPGPRYGGKKPVYVLTAKRTFSGAEEFSYNLKNLKRATLVGETTGGGAHPGGVVRLAPHFGVFVPAGRAINPITKANWEGTGVEPDLRVPAAQALVEAQRLALKPLIEAERDPRRQQVLRDRLAELDKLPRAE